MKISMNKKYTSNGEPVRILCTDRISFNLEYPVVAMRYDGGIVFFTKDGKSAPGIDYDLVEVWEPKKGEWCLFWTELSPYHVILSKFNKTTNDGWFESACGTTWKYCSKFDGTLPEHLKERKDENN
jgi:hypothetical protein